MTKAKHKKIIFGALALAILFAVPVFIFNAQKSSAQTEEGENTDIVCNKEIPIGEALEESSDFTGNVRNVIFNTEQYIEEEITASQELISSVQSCDPNKCNPVCRLIPNTCYAPGGPNSGPIPYSCPICESDYCTGEICPENSINAAYGKVEAAYNKIAGEQKTGQDLIDAKKSSWEYNNQKYVNQTQMEIVQNKLTVARQEFDSCFLSESEWQKYIEGEDVGKQLMSCEDSLTMGKDLSQECREACNADDKSEECRKCLECKSPGNFFCCDVK